MNPWIVRCAYAAAVASLTGMIGLCLAWELWFAPLRPGGSWMVLKVLPLLAPLFGVLHERIYTYRWSSMLMVAYFIEGCFRAYADAGPSASLAAAEIVLSLVFIAAAGAFIRGRRAAST
jgi:uncharacterized membrane protein